MIPLIEAKLKIWDLFSGTIHFETISIKNPTVNYDVIIQNGKIVDSFYLVEGLSKNNRNDQSMAQPAQSDNTKTNISANHKSVPDSKLPRIDFVTDALNISKINISILAKDFQFAKNIQLDQMIFQNVGNTKNSNHYKDVMAMIVMNMAVKINNEVITGNLKKKI